MRSEDRTTDNFPWLVKTKLPIVPTVLLSQPTLEWKRKFAEVFLLEHILVPDDELEDAKLVDEREVDRGVERGIFGIVDGIDSPLHELLLARVEYQYDDKTKQNLRLAVAH